MLGGLGDEMTKWLVTVLRIGGCLVLATGPLCAQGAPVVKPGSRPAVA